MNSIFRELNYFGIIGSVLLILVYINFLIRTKVYFGVVFFIMRLGGGIGYNSGIIIIYIILLNLNIKNKLSIYDRN